MGDSFDLKSSTIHAEARDGYLHIVASGTLRDLAEVEEHNALMESLMSKHGTRRCLLDARGQSEGPSPEVRAAVWAWFRSDRSFDMVAYVVPEGEAMAAARINMTALSLKMNLRAFVSVIEAHRFVARRNSSLMPAVRDPNAPSREREEDKPA